jgi:hypothetical protein
MPTALGYSYCFAGSVGVVVTLPRLPEQKSLMLAGNPIDDTSEIVFDLIESKNITQIANKLGPEPIAAMNDWLGVHMAHGYGLGLEWKSQRVTKRSAEVSYAELSTLQTVVADTTTETTLVLNGELSAVDDTNKTFKITPDEGGIIEGTFGDAITPEHAASVPARYRLTVIKTTRIVLKSKKDKPTTYLLSALEPLRQI